MNVGVWGFANGSSRFTMVGMRKLGIVALAIISIPVGCSLLVGIGWWVTALYLWAVGFMTGHGALFDSTGFRYGLRGLVVVLVLAVLVLVVREVTTVEKGDGY